MKYLAMVCLALGCIPAIAGAADDVQVKIGRMDDRRVMMAQPPPPGGLQNTLEVRLYISGAAVSDSHQAGQLTLDEATDDLGDALKLRGYIPDTMNSTPQLMSVIAVGGGDTPTTRPDDGPFQAQFVLDSPPRKASSIAHLKGEFHVIAGGVPTDVLIPHVKAVLGKEIQNDALMAAGLQAIPSAPAGLPHGGYFIRPGMHRMLGVEVMGKAELLQDAAIIDVSGKTISLPPLRMFGMGEKIYFLDGPQDLDDTMSLRLTVIVGQRNVTVPFDFKDIPLP